MKILALDTTAPTASAAVMEDGRLLAMDTVNSVDSHSVTMLPMADACLRALGMTVAEMDLLACSAGPGSFTGVRIGVSTLKGLAFAGEIPCVGVSTLEALSRNLTGFSGLVVPVMNARRGQVYAAVFASDGTGVPRRLTPDELLPLTELEAQLREQNRPVYFTGDGYSLARETVFLSDVRETPEILRYQNAVHVANLAGEIYSATPAEDREKRFSPAALAPVYLRKPQAEREREERLAQAAKSETQQGG